MLPFHAMRRLLAPQSIAVVGASPDPVSVPGRLFANLRDFGYQGTMHPVSRTRSEVNGRPCVQTIDELPSGIDAAVLIVPQVAVLESVEACVRRGIGGAVVFASGFAEMGEEGKAQQARIAEVAREGGLALLGPNCMGYINARTGACLSFGPVGPSSQASSRRVAVVAQSGAMMGNATLALAARGLSVSYSVSTGNEAVVSVEDVLGYLLEQDDVQTFAVFVETIRYPDRFLRIASRARELGKPIVLLHPGRSTRARHAAQSHTGALAGDHAVMRALVAREGVALVDTLDELFDVSAILACYPRPVEADGAALVSNSGALRGISLDICEDLGVEIAALSQGTLEGLAKALPSYITPDNPLDVTTAGMQNPAVFGQTARILLDDPSVGSLITALMGGQPDDQISKMKSLGPVFAATEKPVAFVLMGDEDPLDAEFMKLVRQSDVPFFRSPDRALRAMAIVHRRSRALADTKHRAAPSPIDVPWPRRDGPLAEYKGKQLLARLGIDVPRSVLATSVDEAAKAAADIGYPVVLKAQADRLTHKSDAGGVIVGIRDEAHMKMAWDQMQASVASYAPDIQLDGLLVESMAAGGGTELVIGARRDPQWGPVVLVGLGGVWIEALADVKVLPVDLDEAGIIQALRELKAVKVLDGLRGQPPADLPAVAKVVRRIADLMMTRPDIAEIDINPFVVREAGKGGVALDALFVMEQPVD